MWDFVTEAISTQGPLLLPLEICIPLFSPPSHLCGSKGASSGLCQCCQWSQALWDVRMDEAPGCHPAAGEELKSQNLLAVSYQLRSYQCVCYAQSVSFNPISPRSVPRDQRGQEHI